MSKKRNYGYIVNNIGGVNNWEELEKVLLKSGIEKRDVLDVVKSWVLSKSVNMVYREERDVRDRLMKKFVEEKLDDKVLEEIDRKVEEEMKRR
jgi:hypothetical protein